MFYLAAAFEDYLRAIGIRHIYCAPHHPQTNGKLERFHCERYHEGIGNITPADVYHGRPDAILRRRAAQKSRTLAGRVRYNRAAAMQGIQGEPTGDLSVPRSRTESQRC